MAKPGYMHLGEVPEEIFQQELFKYLQRKEESPDAKRVQAQFNYKGKNYTFQKGRSSSGYQIKRSSERVAKEAKRRGLYHNQAIPLGEIEQMMVDNYYEEAQKRGLQVDHKIPIARGGPSNAPWNLGLMTPEENAAKAERIGGQYTYEPLEAKNGSIRYKSNVTNTAPPQQTKPVQQPPKPEKPKRRPKSNLKSSAGTIGFGFSELTGGYTGADSMPRRVDMDPLGTGATIMIP